MLGFVLCSLMGAKKTHARGKRSVDWGELRLAVLPPVWGSLGPPEGSDHCLSAEPRLLLVDSREDGAVLVPLACARVLEMSSSAWLCAACLEGFLLPDPMAAPWGSGTWPRSQGKWWRSRGVRVPAAWGVGCVDSLGCTGMERGKALGL